jgi:DNA-binding beta-propeller fold protein YncE
LRSATAGAAATSAPSLPTLTTTSIALAGDGPIGLAVDGTTAWVITADGGELLAVDLSGAAAQRSFSVGPWGTHVLVGGSDEILVARFDTSGTGQPLAIVDPGSGAVGGVATGPLAGFDLAADGRLWNLGTAGEIVVVDAARTSVVGRTAIDVNANEHLDAVAAGDAFFAASDTTPVRRLEGAQPAVTATIETGGGIPLAYANGLVWGARADELWGVDPATNAVAQHVPLDGLIEILDLDVAGERAWIAARKPGRVGVVVGVDLATGRVVGEAPVSLPAGVVIAGDQVWATNYDGDELIGIDQPPA